MTTGRSPFICETLRSRKTYMMFSFSAWWAVVFGVFFVVYFAAIEGTARDFAGQTAIVVLGCLGCVGSVAGLVIFFGMLIYLLKCDPSSRGWKAFWLIVFLIGACFGTSLYFFAVARRQLQGQQPAIPC